MFQQAWAHEYAAEPLAMWCETNEKKKKRNQTRGTKIGETQSNQMLSCRIKH